MQQIPFELLAIVVLILLNGFFAGAEISVVSVRRSQILNLVNSGSKRARLVQKFIDRPDSFLATIQVGVTLAGTTASVLAGNAVVPYLSSWLQSQGLSGETATQTAVILVIILVSYLLLVLGELVPKYLAYAYPRKIALASAPALGLVSKLAFLPARILSVSARAFLFPLGLAKKQKAGAFTEEEINLILSEGEREGRFDQSERELIRGVFEFADTSVRQAMTPRIEIEGIDINSTQEQILKTITTEGYSRYPIYDRTLDEIKGILHSKDIIALLAASDVLVMQDLIRPITFVPDSKPIANLLREFQLKQEHMAIVLDEFGGTAGLITLEDILEEIVGEIRDEHDAEIEPFTRIDADTCLVQAKYPIEDFNSAFSTTLPEDGRADTVAGYVFNHLGRLPVKRERILIDDLEFEIISLVGARIDMMKVRRISPGEPESDSS